MTMEPPFAPYAKVLGATGATPIDVTPSAVRMKPQGSIEMDGATMLMLPPDPGAVINGPSIMSSLAATMCRSPFE